MTEKVVIIGGGPAGLAAAVYTARAGLSPLVFAGSPPGGQLMLTSEVENYPGFESILGAQLIEKIRQQAKKFGAKILDENVVKVDFSKKPFKIYLSGSATSNIFSAKSVIIATGAKALWLGLESEKRLRGKGVSACATCDGFFFKDKVVAVVGGGDTAMEEALTLTKFAKKVYIIHRRDKFRASKIMQERVLKHPKIEIIWNTVVEEVVGEKRVEGVRLKSVTISYNQSPPKVESVKLKKIDSNRFQPISTDRLLKVDGLFVAIGHKPDTDIFVGQVELDSKGYIITSERVALELAKLKVQNPIRQLVEKLTIENSKLEKIKDMFNLDYQYSTSVEGIFAAGDCVDFVYRQAAVAAGMGVAAALEVEKYIEASI
ncbi:MAG: NAD(P)/FAD-dependent oxidoreductase [Microgenomates group bacterium]